MARITYDSKGNDITCMKEFNGLKFPCNECSRNYCEDREHYNVTTMKLSDITIKKSFAQSVPSKNKLRKCEKYWNTFGKQDRYIVVNQNDILVDGYIMYLTLKKLGIDKAEVEIVNTSMPRYANKATVYVYGIHPNSKDKKEYVWRIPENNKGLENDLLPGDNVIVSTKHGFKPVIVTRIEWLSEDAFDFPVGKVVGKIGENPKKIYRQYCIRANDDETRKFLTEAFNITADRKESLKKEVFDEWIANFNKKIRERLGLPNKIFGLCRNNETHEVSIDIFDKEPDGKNHEVFTDENGVYILV